MSKWFYTNEQGEKIEVTGGQLKGLAKAGLIMPETIVENEDGKRARAGKVKGLTFVTATPPVETESYGLVQPSEPNPFTALMPVETKSMEVNPFTATMPLSNQAMPQFSAVPSPKESKNHRNQMSFFAGLGIGVLIIVLGSPFIFFGFGMQSFATIADDFSLPVVVFVLGIMYLIFRLRKVLCPAPFAAGFGASLLILVLIGIGATVKSNFSNGRPFSDGSRVDSYAPTLAQLRQAVAANSGFGDALIRGDERDMNTAILLFGEQISGCSPEFQAAHKELWEAMVAAMVARTNRSGDRDFDRMYSERQSQAYIDSAKRYTSVLDREITRLQSGGR